MIEEYVSLKEAAELEGMIYNSMCVKVSRGDYKTKKKADENGGRERVLIAVSSLSRKARGLYRQKKKIDLSKGNELDDESAPWYVFEDLAHYSEHNKERYYTAVAMLPYVRKCVEYDGKSKVDYVKSVVSEINENILKPKNKTGISDRTLQRYMKSYNEALAWGIEMNKADGKNYEYLKILSLCKKPREQAVTLALNDEMKAVIENIWFNPDFATNLCKYAKLYRVFKDELINNRKYEVEGLPSYDTVRRYVVNIRQKTDNARVLISKGLREWKRTSMVKARRDLSLLRVMEVVVADSHTFDCFVKVTAQNGSEKAIKPVLVGFMDMRSRALVGWSICEMPNAQVIKETIINMIMEKKNKANPFSGVPRVLLIDNGKDYTAEEMTGRKRSERKDPRLELDQYVDDKIKGFYAEVGIQEEMRALPYQAWTKGQIERFFGTVCEDFSKGINSYVGTLTGSQTGAKIKKDIPKMLERGELLSIEEFADRFEYWVLNVYSKNEHSGLREQKERYKTPLEVYLNEDRYSKPAMPLQYLERLAMVKVRKKVYTTGIKLKGCEYMHEALYPYINASKGVIVRYNPKDIRTINVYDEKTDKLICKAENATILNPLAPVGDKSLEAHIKRQKRQEKMAREIIKQAQIPYEERMSNIENIEKAVILPELSGEKQKVVAMPANTRYLEEKREQEENEKNEWLRKQAEEALEEFRRNKLG